MFALLARNFRGKAFLRRTFTSQPTSNLAIHNEEFKSTLISKRQISHDSYIFQFDLPNKDLPLGLLPGQHVRIHVKQTKVKKDKVKTEDISRKYTPISSLDQKGLFDMLIKIYDPTPTYPEGGEMSQLLKKLKLGDQVGISGPLGRTIYKGKGDFQLEGTKIHVTDVGFVIGGSGITPAYQILREIYLDKEDKTKAHLLFANRAEDEILLKEELDQMAKDPRFNIHYTVDKAKTADWKGFEGYITKEMIQKIFPGPSDNILMTFCGNKPMRKLVFGLFDELKYKEDLTARF